MHSLKRLLRFSTPPLEKRVHDPAVNIHCGEFEVDNWAVSKFIVDDLVSVVGTHPFPINELFLMVAANCRFKPAHIVEWGTHVGKSARIFYETARYFEFDVEIHSIDLPDNVPHQEHPGHQRGQMVKGLKGVHLYEGDGLTVCRDISTRIGTSGRTLVFIDGDHHYDSVLRELTGVMACLPHADILLHDTFFQSPSSGYNIGPHRAIMDALAKAPRSYRLLSCHTGLPGMTLLYQSPSS
jgi:hypothetical protein